VSAPPDVVGENELAFFFQTNEPVPARPLLIFIAEVERIALTKRHLGPSAIVEVTEIRTGTKLVRLTFDQKIKAGTLGVAVGGLVVAVAHLGLDIADRIQQPHGRLAESVAEMCLDNGVVECVVTTREGKIRISRDDVAATMTVEAKRTGQFVGRTPNLKSYPLDVDGAVSASEMASAVPDPHLYEAERVAELPRQKDGRLYTVLGYLSPPGTTGNAVRRSEGQFRTQSGKTYVARGVDWDRVPRGSDPVVIRARVAGEVGGHTVLNVFDVFEPEEP
jgi:hypothetical protein